SDSQSNWIVDSSASHYITSDLQNLSIHNNYCGNKDIIIGDGKGIPITLLVLWRLIHIPLLSHSIIFCTPHIKRNFIFVSQFCKQNHTSIEFSLEYFLVKD
ncbi:hypothetical protein B296_00038930, partial [Ensete ventricosum]